MAEDDQHGDHVLAHGLTHTRRRDVLGLGGLAAEGVGPAARRGGVRGMGGRGGAGRVGAACGGGGSPKPPPVAHAQNAVARFWAAQKQHGHVNFANWPLYIDTGHKTLDEFTATTGITVSYAEVIQEDSYWVNKITPIIRAGESIGFDLMVVTNGFWLSQLLTMGELIPLDQSLLPNFHKYAAAKFRHRSFDPGNTYSIPWASGTTGIAWNPKFI